MTDFADSIWKMMQKQKPNTEVAVHPCAWSDDANTGSTWGPQREASVSLVMCQHAVL